MKFQKTIATVMAISALATVPAMASASDSQIYQGPAAVVDSQAATNKLPLGEFVRAAVVQMAGEQAPLMDTHYAHTYMMKAEELGLLTVSDYDMEIWSETISAAAENTILSNMEAVGADMEAFEATLVALQPTRLVVSSVEVDKDFVVYEGNVLVPLRAVAETLGFTVTWTEETKTIGLTYGEMDTTLQLGYNCYGDEGVALSSAPILVGGNTTYVPMDAFTAMMPTISIATFGDTIDFQLPMFG